MSEYWDLLDCNACYTGDVMLRGEKQPLDTWHCVVGIVIENSNDKILMIKRSDKKEQFPNMWEHIGGCVIAGEAPIEAACREVSEEIGIGIKAEELELIDKFFEKTAYINTYLLKKDFDISKCTVDRNEVSKVRWINKDKIINRHNEYDFSPASIRRLYRIINRI